jgi:hypothetical protein
MGEAQSRSRGDTSSDCMLRMTPSRTTCKSWPITCWKSCTGMTGFHTDARCCNAPCDARSHAARRALHVAPGIAGRPRADAYACRMPLGGKARAHRIDRPCPAGRAAVHSVQRKAGTRARRGTRSAYSVYRAGGRTETERRASAEPRGRRHRPGTGLQSRQRGAPPRAGGVALRLRCAQAGCRRRCPYPRSCSPSRAAPTSVPASGATSNRRTAYAHRQ